MSPQAHWWTFCEWWTERWQPSVHMGPLGCWLGRRTGQLWATALWLSCRYTEGTSCKGITLAESSTPRVLQVMGRANGMMAIRGARPVLLLSGLPAIPVLLILGKTVRWNHCVLKLWQKCCYEPKLPSGTCTPGICRSADAWAVSLKVKCFKTFYILSGVLINSWIYILYGIKFPCYSLVINKTEF